ncbi:MAG: UDP-N-acetylmuramoyl-L-alanine--D-glutamate ligase [Patescibacteria group bacterium]
MTTAQMKELRKLRGQKIALLGLGLDNQALLSVLDRTKLPLAITICDFRPRNKLPRIKAKNLKINYQLGADFNKDLDRFDRLFRSPGWPLACPGIKAARQKGQTEITNPLNLFFALSPTKNIIGVTGTKGKGTTASLIYRILKDASSHNKRWTKARVWLGGNIGVSPLSFIDRIKPDDYVVLELSSFQLEDLKYAPRWAVITNLFPEHLAPADPHNPNFHNSPATYWRAKLNIARTPSNRYLVANQSLKNKLRAADIKSKIIYFRANSLPSRLTGVYNQENIGAAVAIAKVLKIAPAIYEKTVASFRNLEHRLELAATINGIKYFDNSFSTTPESTILDLESFRAPLILIAGGADKGANFRTLAKAIKDKVKFLILLDGQATPRIKKALTALKFPKEKLASAKGMEEAVALARTHSARGDVILLSTACASFGLFKNYKDRGEQFKYYARQKK